MNIDLSPMYKIIDANVNELKNIDRQIRRIADKAIQFEKQNHQYINRTGNLERNTVAEVTKSGDEIEASLQMNTSYASYVVDKGYSRIYDAAEMMENDIEDYLTRLGTSFE